VPIEFPINDLDLSPFVKDISKKDLVYELSGVCNHFGYMGGGHYIAYAKAHNGGWYEFNDGLVTKIEMTKIVSPAAYVLFYRLRSF
jgi:ubiquitin carboxyl-terminal hydrolase 15